jgi:FtsH Extracellular
MTEAVQQHRSWYKRPLLWIVAAIVIGLGAFGVRQMLNGPPRIAYGEFFNQLAAGNIASVRFSGTQIDGKFKHPVVPAPASGAATQGDFRSQVPDFGDSALIPQLRQEHIPIAVTSSFAYFWGTSAVIGGILAVLLAKPMLLIIAAAFVAGVVRLARGGKMDMKATLAMLPMFRSFSAEGEKAKDSPARADPPPAENEMADAAQQHCTKAWYLRPPVWIAGIIVVALALFGVIEMTKGPAAISYSDFLDQLDAGNVVSISIAGTQIDGKFKTAVKEGAAKDAVPQTAFRSQVPAFGDSALLPELREQHVAIDVVSSSGWLSWLGRLPWPMVVIIVGLLIAGLVKLARGDKATTGSALPSHPMVGAFTSVFGKTEQQMSGSAADQKAPRRA